MTGIGGGTLTGDRISTSTSKELSSREEEPVVRGPMCPTLTTKETLPTISPILTQEEEGVVLAEEEARDLVPQKVEGVETQVGAVTLKELASLKLHMCLGAVVERWELIGCGPLVASWFRYGIPWELDEVPKPYIARKLFLSEEHYKARDEKLLRVQKLGCFEEMPDELVSTAVIEEMFMVPKPDSKKLRTVHNMKRSNASSHKIHFKMEGLRDVKDMVRPWDFMTKWDFKDAYLHLFWKFLYRKYAGFRWKGKFWQWIIMIFGHVHAPRWWTRAMRPLVKFLRACGIRCVINKF